MATKIKERVRELCQRDPDTGEIAKHNITMARHAELKAAMKDFGVTFGPRNLSYRQYCKVFDTHLFKYQKRCGKDGGICCQAITEDGTRCTRAASKFTSVDLTERKLVPTLPRWLRERLGVRKSEALKLMGYANACCFYCWQHAAIYVANLSTFVSNPAYYLTHPEDVLRVFFEKVEVRKLVGLLTYRVHVEKMRSVDEILKFIAKTSADTQGAFATYYWAVYTLVFLYDKIKPVLIKTLARGDDKAKAAAEKRIQAITERASLVFLKINDAA